MTEREKKKMMQSRRDFLKSVGKVTLVTATAAALPLATNAEADAPAYPFTYKHVDPIAAGDRTYAAFSQLGGCAASVFDGIVGQMGDEYGAPYNGLPPRMFADGAAGYGAGSLCGCLGGAAACFGLFCEAADARDLLAQLMTWYRTSEVPEYDRGEPCIATVVPGSVNCVDSLSKFFAATGITQMNDPNRINRCACLAASTAEHVANMLNEHFGV